MPPFGPPLNFQYDRVPPPKGVRDVPRYLKELLGGFFGRFAYIFKLIWATGRWIPFAMSLIALFRGVAPVAGALISKDVLNELQAILAQGGIDSIWGARVLFLLVFFFIYRILTRVVDTLNTAVTRIAGEKVVQEVKLQIMRKARELDLASFDLPAFYEKLENANREAGMRPITFLSDTFKIISTLIELVSYIVVLVTAPSLWWFVPVLMAVSVPSAIINFVYRRRNFKYVRFRSKERRQMNYYADTVVNKDLVKEIRVFDLADTFIARYKSVFRRYYHGLRRLIVQESAWHIGIGIISGAINLLFYILVARLVITGRILIGDYTLYTSAIVSVTSSVSALISTSATIYEGTLFIDNLISFMKEKPAVVPRLAEPLQPARGTGHTVEFVHVSFRYPGTERDILHNINLTFRPGETVVLVGLNGAGKTTLIKLLTRLYDPTEGYILLDGKDLRDYDLQSLYKMFGIIFQDFGKYAVNAGENIAFGDVHRPPARQAVEEAARQSNAAEFIERLPHGYDTPLMRYFEPTGLELSIGQWQKLAIARAFYSDNDILILDEPTASLDPMAEQEIFNQFDRLRVDKTTIFVSHRLSSATVASLIVVLENGRVAETGTHPELMARRGRYYQLFSTQAERYLSADQKKEDSHA